MSKHKTERDERAERKAKRQKIQDRNEIKESHDLWSVIVNESDLDSLQRILHCKTKDRKKLISNGKNDWEQIRYHMSHFFIHKIKPKFPRPKLLKIISQFCKSNELWTPNAFTLVLDYDSYENKDQFIAESSTNLSKAESSLNYWRIIELYQIMRFMYTAIQNKVPIDENNCIDFEFIPDFYTLWEEQKYIEFTSKLWDSLVAYEVSPYWFVTILKANFMASILPLPLASGYASPTPLMFVKIAYHLMNFTYNIDA